MPGGVHGIRQNHRQPPAGQERLATGRVAHHDAQVRRAVNQFTTVPGPGGKPVGDGGRWGHGLPVDRDPSLELVEEVQQDGDLDGRFVTAGLHLEGGYG